MSMFGHASSAVAHKRLSSCRRYAFTINNYSNSDYVDMTEHFCRRYNPIFLVVGKAIGYGTACTNHLQCFVHLSERVRVSQLRKMISAKGHYEMAKGSDRSNYDYCAKQDSCPFVYGNIVECVTEKGGRTMVYEAAVDLAHRLTTVRDISECIEDDPLFGPAFLLYQKPIHILSTCLIHKNNLESYYEEFKCVQLRLYQKEIYDIVCGSPDDHKIYWYHECIGGVGKTWMSKYLVVTKGAVCLENAKSADVKYAYKGEKIAIWDLSRSQQDHINYEVLESIKNGVYLNTKYDFGMRVFRVPHVIVFANCPPDMSKLSYDRWAVRQVNMEDMDYDPEPVAFEPPPSYSLSPPCTSPSESSQIAAATRTPPTTTEMLYHTLPFAPHPTSIGMRKTIKRSLSTSRTSTSEMNCSDIAPFDEDCNDKYERTAKVCNVLQTRIAKLWTDF